MLIPSSWTKPSSSSGPSDNQSLSPSLSSFSYLSLWWDSYKNSALHCSAYVGILAACFQALNRSTNSRSVNSNSSSKASTDVAISVVGAITSCCLYYEIRYLWMRKSLPPGDSGYPVVGHLQPLITNPVEMKLRQMEKFGSPCVFNLMMIPIVQLVDEDDITWATKEERRGNFVPQIVPFLMDLVGHETIMMESGQRHKRLRKMFEPSFSPVTVKGYTQLIDKITKQTLEDWSTSKLFQSSDEWSFLAMKLFFACALGEDAVDATLFKTITTLFQQWEVGFSTTFPVNIPGTALSVGHDGKKGLDRALMNLIDEFRINNPPGSKGAESSMLGRLCYGSGPDQPALTDSQIAANIRFIVFAGHDTTKGSFCAFVHYLLKEMDPAARKMLVDEVMSFQEPLDADELKSARILNAFMAETWRLVPPLDAHNLRAVRPVRHPSGFVIPKRAQVSIDLQSWSLIDPDTYPNPAEFRVERWIPEGHPLYDPTYHRNGVDYNLMSAKYRSFHLGAHMCLGGHFAKLEARIVLTRLLQNYTIELCNESFKPFPLRQYANEFKLIPKQHK